MNSFKHYESFKFQKQTFELRIPEDFEILAGISCSR